MITNTNDIKLTYPVDVSNHFRRNIAQCEFADKCVCQSSILGISYFKSNHWVKGNIKWINLYFLLGNDGCILV